MKAYPSPAMRHRFMSVVKSEVDAASVSKEEGTGKGFITMEIPFPVNDYAKLRLLVSEKRVDGKKVTIQEFVRRLILDHVYKHMSH